MAVLEKIPTPYPFQTELVEYLSKEPNVLIGDDMGLGKTVEAILLDKVRRKGFPPGNPCRTLVIAPAGAVVESWLNHFATWAPSLKVTALDPKNRPAFIEEVKAGQYDVYVMHWDALRLIIDDIKRIYFLHVIGDEIHRIKNRKAQVNRAANKLRCKYKTGCSGTAADNQPEDLWAVLNWLWPGKWRSFWSYVNHHVKYKSHDTSPIGCAGCLNDNVIKVHKRPFREVVGVGNADVLHRQMKPFYMRRRKEDVLKDLPDKYYSEVKVELDPQQRRAYDQMQEEMLAWVGEHEDEPLAAPVVIAQLVRLQQFAVGYGEIIMVEKRNPNTGDLERKPTLKLTEPSSKLDALMQIIEDNPDQQLIVFAQSKQAMNMLKRRLEAKNIPCGLLTGDTPMGIRGGIINDFQAGRLRVFAGTYGAGGIGITLTAASTVVQIDRPWSPSVESQAIDRAHRIGQKNAVHVISLVAKNTIDARRGRHIDLKWERLKELLGDPKPVKKMKEDK